MTVDNHPLTDATIAGIWTRHSRDRVFEATGRRYSSDLPMIRESLRAAYDRGLADATVVDTNSWEPLTDWDNVIGRKVRRTWANGDCIETSSGVVARFDRGGDPCTAEGYRIGLRDSGTWEVRDIPDNEVELPTVQPAYLTDVENDVGDVCAYMALGSSGNWIGVDKYGESHVWSSLWITSATLQDGTHIQHDGDRFIKVVDE